MSGQREIIVARVAEGGELPVEVGVQRVRGGREELVKVQPLLGGEFRLQGSWEGGYAVQVMCFVFFFSE